MIANAALLKAFLYKLYFFITLPIVLPSNLILHSVATTTLTKRNQDIAVNAKYPNRQLQEQVGILNLRAYIAQEREYQVLSALFIYENCEIMCLGLLSCIGEHIRKSLQRRDEIKNHRLLVTAPHQRAFAFCVISFEPIRIQTHLAPQT